MHENWEVINKIENCAKMQGYGPLMPCTVIEPLCTKRKMCCKPIMERRAYTPPLLCKHLTTLNKNPKKFLFDKNAHIDHSYISVRQIFKIKFIEEVFFLTTLKLANYYNI